jgi:adenine phosphoribosyltransferase
VSVEFYGNPLTLERFACDMNGTVAGKLPGDCVKIEYSTEYSSTCLEIRKDAFHFHRGATLVSVAPRVLIVDDLLATGGTLKAAVEAVRAVGGDPIAALVVIAIASLKGADNVAVDVYAAHSV